MVSHLASEHWIDNGNGDYLRDSKHKEVRKMGKTSMTKLTVVKEFALPKTVKVALWVGVSAALTFLVNNVADLQLDANKQMVLVLIINSVLAGLNEFKKNM